MQDAVRSAAPLCPVCWPHVTTEVHIGVSDAHTVTTSSTHVFLNVVPPWGGTKLPLFWNEASLCRYIVDSSRELCMCVDNSICLQPASALAVLKTSTLRPAPAVLGLAVWTSARTVLGGCQVAVVDLTGVTHLSFCREDQAACQQNGEMKLKCYVWVFVSLRDFSYLKINVAFNCV